MIRNEWETDELIRGEAKIDWVTVGETRNFYDQ